MIKLIQIINIDTQYSMINLKFEKVVNFHFWNIMKVKQKFNFKETKI